MVAKIVAYDFIPDTIIGSVWIAATKDGLLAVDFDLTELEFVKKIREPFRVHFNDEKHLVTPFTNQINAYLQKEIIDLDVEVDLSKCSDFQRKVLLEVKEIPYGQAITYAELARRVGDPKAFRAVGQALRRNPVPIAVPCHRVLHSDGTLGGYGGVMGSKRKIKLLKLEGVILT
jgi:methylated-DNA-[protein]-cysteine S-methyltransferase